MKTIVRGILAAGCLVASLVFVRSESAAYLIEEFLSATVQPYSAVFVLLAVAGLPTTVAGAAKSSRPSRSTAR